MEQTIRKEGATASLEVAELVKQLPIKLRVGIRPEVVALAMSERIIRLTADGRWEWMLESKTLQAYFCGRMWCGDTLEYSRRRQSFVWKPGKSNFPERDLCALFGVTGLREVRRKREFCVPPCGFQLIENLFVASETGNPVGIRRESAGTRFLPDPGIR